MTPNVDAQVTLRLKVERNARKHGRLLNIKHDPFVVDDEWYRARAAIASFEVEKLFGVKLRALPQQRRNRDLFDLHHGLGQRSMAPAQRAHLAHDRGRPAASSPPSAKVSANAVKEHIDDNG